MRLRPRAARVREPLRLEGHACTLDRLDLGVGLPKRRNARAGVARHGSGAMGTVCTEDAAEGNGPKGKWVCASRKAVDVGHVPKERVAVQRVPRAACLPTRGRRA